MGPFPSATGETRLGRKESIVVHTAHPFRNRHCPPPPLTSRSVIHKLCLRLPENAQAFAALAARGAHPAFETALLRERYPLKSPVLLGRLQVRCGAMRGRSWVDRSIYLARTI